jgi:hypothetical protein
MTDLSDATRTKLLLEFYVGSRALVKRSDVHAPLAKSTVPMHGDKGAGTAEALGDLCRWTSSSAGA